MHDVLGRIVRSVVPGGVVLLMVAVGVVGLMPPAASSTDADPVEFSAERALVHVVAIAVEPRPSGSPASGEAGAYIAAELEKLGLEPEMQVTVAPDYYRGIGEVEVVNVIALIPGTDPTGAIVLMGHYDTVPWSPGANDDAVAVAAIIETARALMSRAPLRNDVILLFTDGEEPAPKFGSTAFLERHPLAPEVRLALNFETIGGAGASNLIEVLGDERLLIGEYSDVVTHPAATSFIDDVAELVGGSNTDIAAFRERGIAGFEFAYLQGSSIYHTAGDDVGSVNLRGLQHHGDTALALVTRFGNRHLDTVSAAENQEVFFTFAGRSVVHYPVGFGVLAILSVGAIGGWSLAGVWRRSATGLLPILGATGTLLGIAFGVGALAAVAWRLLTQLLWAETGPSGIGEFASLPLLVVASVALSLAALRRVEARFGEEQAEIASFALWWLLGLASAVALPGAGYMFVWPLLVVVLVWPRQPRSQGRAALAAAAVAAVALIPAVPVVDFAFQFAHPRPGNLDSQVPEAVLVVGLLVSLLTTLLLPHLRRARG